MQRGLLAPLVRIIAPCPSLTLVSFRNKSFLEASHPTTTSPKAPAFQ
jgi:hypothetical protein